MSGLKQVVSPVDGIIVIQDPDQRMAIMALDQLYLGREGKGKYAGKVHDYVIDRTIPNAPTWFIIAAVNDDLIPRLEPVEFKVNQENSTIAKFVGVGPGQVNNNLRCYVDKRTWPYTCQIDTRFAIPGSMNSYARVYIGSVTENKKECISRIFDQNGALLGDAVPMEPSNDPKYGEGILKVVGTFKTTVDLKDNELLTLVVFSDDGVVTTQEPILAMNTSFIATPDQSKRYIKDIQLLSAFIDAGQPNLIKYPLNAPINAMNLACRVEYSDGEVVVPVDGNKARISGLDGFIATIPGQEIPDVTLHYLVGPEEYNYSMRVANENHISRSYRAVIVDQDISSIIVKLFITFEWLDETNGYKLHYWLYNVSRTRYWDVTNLVRPADSSMTFNPIAYGTLQRMVVYLDLEKVDFSFKTYRFVQSFDIVLNQPTHQSPWLVHYENGQKLPTGSGLFAEYRYLASGYTELKLNCHKATVDDWLEALYYNTKPLANRISEGIAPRPTHFEIQVDDWSSTYLVERDWNKIVVIGKSISNYRTMIVRFYMETATNELQLATIAVLMKDAATLPFYSEFSMHPL